MRIEDIGARINVDHFRKMVMVSQEGMIVVVKSNERREEVEN